MRILIIIIILIYLIQPLKAYAESGNSVITVSPQLIQLDLSKDPSEAVYEYTNDTTQTIELSLSMQDVKELEDRGIPGLLDQTESSNYKYGLSKWARFSNNNIVIEPSETKKVTVFIDKTRLTLGGHYASILAEIKQPENKKELRLRAIITSLLFVRSGSGFETEEATINSFLMDQDNFSFPKNATFKFKNVGNVDLTPHGLLTITDPFGREISRAIVNEDSLITLPDSERKYSLPLSSKIAILAPGMYKAELSISYGKKNVKKLIKMDFFSLGSLSLDIIIVIAALGGAGSFLLLKLRRGNNS